MPTALTFMSRTNSILGLSEPENAEFLILYSDISISNFMLRIVEHFLFYNLGACFDNSGTIFLISVLKEIFICLSETVLIRGNYLRYT